VREIAIRGPQNHRAVGSLVEPAGVPELVLAASPHPSGRVIVVRPEDTVIIVPEWLADLDDPTLVISSGYIGPDRRRSDRSVAGSTDPTPRTSRFRLLKRIGQVACMTLVVAVPLTLISSRSVPPATSGSPPAATASNPKAGGHAGRQAKHVFTASPHQLARAEAAYQRALARQQGVSVTGSDGVGVAGAMGGGGGPSAGRSAEAAGGVAQPSAPATSAQSGAVARQQSAQTRAADQAATAVHRAQAQGARGAAQAAKAAGNGRRTSGDTPPTSPGS
jgi:hypothetical protein